MNLSRHVSTNHQKALALIVVVYVLAALGTLAFALALRSQIGVYQAQLRMDRAQQDGLAQAACVQACRVLATDDPDVDSHDDTWSGWHALQMPQDSGNAISGQVWWRLADESAKINVNQVSSDVLAGIEGLDQAVVASILDWIDQDELPNPDGAEKEYYTSLSPGYACRNGPLESLEELALIKGITADLYFGTGKPETLEELEASVLEQTQVTADDEGALGLNELLTIYGEGRINLNTALPNALRAVPLLSDSAISEILSRQQSGAVKFAKPEDIETTDAFSLTDKIVLSRVAKFNSSYFQLQVRSQLDGMSSICEYSAILERDGTAVRFLNWQRKLPRIHRRELQEITNDRGTIGLVD